MRGEAVWQRAHQLLLDSYQLTPTFPADERFGLVSQMRQAAVSVPANIAEGFKRRGQADKARFYNISEASLEEWRYYFILSKDLGYIQKIDALRAKAESISRMLNRLISSIKRRGEGVGRKDGGLLSQELRRLSLSKSVSTGLRRELSRTLNLRFSEVLRNS